MTAVLVSIALLGSSAAAQESKTGAVCGTVKDASGAVIAAAKVDLSGQDARREVLTGTTGEFCFRALAAGKYEVAAQARGFQREEKDVEVVSGETAASAEFTLSVTSVSEEVTVAEGPADLVSLNVTQTQIGEGLLRNLPSESVNAALTSILTLATPGVAADSNGVFHPLGEHAETSFSVDGQPISDQQSRIFSNQIALSTIQEMRTIQGAPPAEFGDKTSLVVEATTRSGLNAGTRGTISTGYGSFDTPSADFDLSMGTERIGNFVAMDGINSRRFLDTPEFTPLHASGNAESVFDRFDWHASEATAIHVNLSAARSWFQVPNTYDQENAGQDQRQHMDSFNAAIAFSRILRGEALLTANVWVRQDRVGYFPSANVFSDQPATLSQQRRLTSTGARSDVAGSRGRHVWKTGVQMQVTPLSEAFQTGLTDASFNSPCVDRYGAPVGDAALVATAQCGAAGYMVNSGFQPNLLPYDLTRGGALFVFRGKATIFEESAYVQDSVKLGQWHLNAGMRFDVYQGLSDGWGVQPRVGATYQVRATGTVVHASYARIFLTPYNENLVLSSSTGEGGLAGGSLGAAGVQALTPARRNQFNVGVEQWFGSKLSVQGEYFWKYTDGAYDFNTILNTPLNFPIQFRESKIDGALARVTLNSMHGFSAFTVMGHARSRLFGPEIGGINFGTAYAPVARPDHDQGFEQTTNLQYQFSAKWMRGLWAGLTWRYDSGLVVVSVPDFATALTLTADQQQEIGLYCGTVFATLTAPLRSCASATYGATLIHIVAPGTYNADTNPSRIAPRNLFDVAIGSDSVWKKDAMTVGVKMTVVNLMDKVALYNFLSSFSGTHFVAPRTVQGQVTVRF